MPPAPADPLAAINDVINTMTRNDWRLEDMRRVGVLRGHRGNETVTVLLGYVDGSYTQIDSAHRTVGSTIIAMTPERGPRRRLVKELIGADLGTNQLVDM